MSPFSVLNLCILKIDRVTPRNKIEMAFNGRSRMTSNHVDKIMVDRRRVESQNNDLIKYANYSQVQAQSNRGDHLVNQRRRSNNVAQLAAERMLDDKIIASEHAARESALRREQNQGIANALEEERRENERKEREYQRICDSSEELRELESKLQIAYMNKERAVQQTEKTTLCEMERQREKAINDQMEYDRQRALVAGRNEDMIQKAKAMEGKQMIQTQMVERMRLREESIKEAALDKTKVNAVMDKIRKEDEADSKKRHEHVQATRSVIQGAIKQRELDLAEKKRIEDEEEERVASYGRHRAAREAGIKAKNDEKKRREEQAFRAVEAEIKRKQREEDELNALRDDLWTEEMHVARMLKEKKKVDKIRKDKEDMIAANSMLLASKHEQAICDKEQEEEYNEFLRQKFAAQANEEAEKVQDLLRRKGLYKSEIELQNAARHTLYQKELEREQDAVKIIQEKEEFEQRVIEEAKQRIVAQHEATLRGYMPKGI